MVRDPSGLPLIRVMIWVAIWIGSTTAALAQTNAATWLGRYQEALDQLKTPPNVGFVQRTQYSGWQTGDMRVQFQVTPEGWQADITELDRRRTLSSQQIDPVYYKSRAAIYTGYITRPQRLAPEAVFPLLPTTEPVKLAQPTTWAGQPVNYIAFAGGVPIREIWLDPVRNLPRRIHWVDSGSYGTADIFMDFGPVGADYWLPTRSLVQIRLNFWVPLGFSTRSFEGPLTLETTYEDYQLPAQAKAPVMLPVAPTPTPTSKAALLAEEAPAPRVAPPVEPTPKGFNLSASNQTSTSLLADRIAAFNLQKPDVVDPYTNINILLTLRWGAERWPTYLFRFQTKQPLLPLESVTSGDQKSFPFLSSP